MLLMLCRDIERDDRRWNGCASSSLSYSAAHPLPRTYTFRARRIFLAPAMAHDNAIKAHEQFIQHGHEF
jgi:hypothetical protein